MQENEFDAAMGANGEQPQTPEQPIPAMEEGAEIVTDADAPAAEVDTKPRQMPGNAEFAATPKPKDPTALENAAAIKHIKDASVGDLNLTPSALATKEKLSKQRKLPVMIPLSPGEKLGAVKVVNINGYRFEIKKNRYVYVPEAVANMIMKSQQASAEVAMNNPRNLANANDGTRAALNA